MQVVLKEDPFHCQHRRTEVVEQAHQLVLKLGQPAGGIEVTVGRDHTKRASLTTPAGTGLKHGIAATSETGIDS